MQSTKIDLYVNRESEFCGCAVESSSEHMEAIEAPALVPCIHMILNHQAENNITKFLVVLSFTSIYDIVISLSHKKISSHTACLIFNDMPFL
jgi:hypothetical protein